MPNLLRREFGVPEDAQVLLTLSRISPEKGQDLLLEALLEWERRDDFPQTSAMAVRLRRRCIHAGTAIPGETETACRAAASGPEWCFPDTLPASAKRAFFALADVFVFPSRYESYGLTLLEALAHGLPAVCLDHHGARSVMREEFGAIVQPNNLTAAVARLLADDAGRKRMGEAAGNSPEVERFADRAAELAAMLTS